MKINLLIIILFFLTCGAATIATIVFCIKDKIKQGLISIMVIGLGGTCLIFFSQLLFNIYARPDTNAESMNQAIYATETDVDGTFCYKDADTNQFVLKNTNDHDVTINYTLAHRPVIYQGVKYWGFLYDDVIIYCYPVNN